MRYIDLHTHHPQINQISVEILSFNTSVESIKEIPHLFCNGIHPWDADKVACQNIEKKLMPFFLAEKFMGLGEIGLDKNSTIDFEIQKQVLAKQLEIARRFEIKNIQVHLLKSDQEFNKILKESKFAGKIILHGFNGSPERIESFIKNDNSCQFFFSIGPIIFKDSNIRKNILKIPKDRLFFETDDQLDFTIKDIYKEAAQLLNIEESLLTHQVYSNFKTHFSKEAFTKT